MHRTFQKPWALLGAWLALLMGGLPSVSRAQLNSPENRPLVVVLQGTTRLQMSTRKPIRTVVNPKEGILSIRTIERDPTTVLLVGQGPGITRVELEDADGNRESREVVVQADVEYLNQQLRKAIPASAIQVIPNGTSTVVLTGYVGRAEDVQVAQSIAASVGFQVINGLRLNGVQQVQLDVVIAEVRRTKDRSFGFNFIGNARQSVYGSTPGSILTLANPIGVTSSSLQPTGFGQAIRSLPGGPANGTIFGGVIGNAAGFLGFLQALEIEGLAKVLAQPRLVTLSGNPASFLEGGEQAIPVPAGLGQVGVQFEEFGTRLNFLPIVLGNGRIHLEVEPEVSRLDEAAGTTIAGATVPGRATQRIHTTVEMETGQTFAIGGLIQKEVNAQAQKVPVIGQVPFLGALFSNKSMEEREVELVVLVTPHLVDPQSSSQVGKVLPGQESRTPDDFELFLEGILEAPRGPRAVFQGNRYVPAHRNGPTADLYPAAGRTDGLNQMPISPAGGLTVGTTAGMMPGPAAAIGNGVQVPPVPLGTNLPSGNETGNGGNAAVPAPPGVAPPVVNPPVGNSPAVNPPGPGGTLPRILNSPPVTPTGAQGDPQAGETVIPAGGKMPPATDLPVETGGPSLTPPPMPESLPQEGQP
ncbi:MAG: hypothetical protein U0840_01725 [Gemmataceae bacterium]